VFQHLEKRTQDRKRARLQVQAKELGFYLVQLQPVP
jgi:hypothetical protein